MRSKISVLLIVGFVVSLCALTTWAQEEEQKDQLLFVDEYAVKPSMAEKFEALMKEGVALRTQHKYPYSIMIYSLNDFHYISVYSLENYADITNVFKADDELREKIGKEKMQALMKEWVKTYEYYNTSMIYMVPELSYNPENPRLKPEEGNFIFWEIYYVHPGKGTEFEEIIKKFMSIFKDKKMTEGVNVLVGDIGTDNPVYAFSVSAKDEADFYVHNDKMWELLGEEGKMLIKKMLPLVRKNEVKQGWFRADLSYMPKEK